VSTILVTGGTGVLGRHVVSQLAGQNVRVLSRRETAVPGAELVRGDLATGSGVAEAVRGADVVVHCASDPVHWHDDVTATDRLIGEAKAAGRPHLVYISIVGVDRVPLPYYRAKLAAESLVRDSGLPWTLLRATQFHDLVLQFVAAMAKSPLMPVPKGISVQPVDTAEVAERLAGLALGDPAGRVADFGGPQVLTAEEAARAFLAAAGLRRRLVGVPLPGRTAAAYRAGWHLLGEGGQKGTRTFSDFLAERVGPGGKVEFTYYRPRRR